MITYEDFEKVDVRVGKIIAVHDFPEARKPAYKLDINFGSEIGMRKSSAQIVTNYTKDELLGMQVVCIVNFLSKQIGPFVSDVLVLGVTDASGNVVLLSPTKDVTLGSKMY